MAASTTADGPGLETGPTSSKGKSAQGVVDLSVDVVLLAIDALGVDTEEYVNAVAGALGDLGGRDARIEPGRDGRVPQVIGPGREA
jgi:hypothetical protein